MWIVKYIEWGGLVLFFVFLKFPVKVDNLGRANYFQSMLKEASSLFAILFKSQGEEWEMGNLSSERAVQLLPYQFVLVSSLPQIFSCCSSFVLSCICKESTYEWFKKLFCYYLDSMCF